MRVATLFLAVTIAAGCSKEAPAPQRPAPQVSVSTVTPQTIPHVMTFVAQTESSRRVDIVARISGFLERIAYREGELVKEGQVLFELDRKPLQGQVGGAEGQVPAQGAPFPPPKGNPGGTKAARR